MYVSLDSLEKSQCKKNDRTVPSSFYVTTLLYASGADHFCKLKSVDFFSCFWVDFSLGTLLFLLVWWKWYCPSQSKYLLDILWKMHRGKYLLRIHDISNSTEPAFSVHFIIFSFKKPCSVIPLLGHCNFDLRPRIPITRYRWSLLTWNSFILCGPKGCMMEHHHALLNWQLLVRNRGKLNYDAMTYTFLYYLVTMETWQKMCPYCQNPVFPVIKCALAGVFPYDCQRKKGL